MSKVIVTGGKGFIGSHLVDKLIDLKYEVHVIDDESAESNEKFYENENAIYHKISINDLNKNNSTFFKNAIVVFHLAAESRIGPAIKDPLKAIKVNVLGTGILLELSRHFNIKKFIYSSTSSVYGLKCKIPTDEKTDIDCLNPYSATKFGGEELVRMYSKMYNLDTCIFRYFNVFGERSPTKGVYAPVIGLFFKALESNENLKIVGDGEQRRDFVHVNDVVSANILAFKHDNLLNGEVFNVGCGKNYSINEIASFISKNSEYIPFREGEARNTLANIDKIKNILNYTPNFDVKQWIDDYKK
jgi:UDP-glucose 4-epimerase